MPLGRRSAGEAYTNPTDVLVALLRDNGSYYFVPSQRAIDSIYSTRKVASVELVAATEGGFLLKLAGGDPQASPAASIEGFSILLPDWFERAASERRVKVQALVRSAIAHPTRVATAYSTNEVGNSGWHWRDVGSGWTVSEFVWSVPKMRDGRGDFVGILPAEPGTPGVLVHSVAAIIL